MKRLLFFPGHRIIAYEWQRGRFRRVEAFEPDEEGRIAFRAWLEELPRTPIQLLLDVIEEEFHVDHVPHVIGRDRAALLRRTAQKHFRVTEFRYITVQGREARGRRDDRVLVAGLTNPEILKTWLSLIDAARVPLKGVYSLPLVGERLLPHLGAARASRALVVSQQVPSTLRQSYYERGRLRFSRLVPGRYADAQGYVDFVRRELDQTLHFLETQRFRRRDDPIEVYVVAGGDTYQPLREGLASSDTVTCHLVPAERLAPRVGIRGGLPGAFADAIYAQILLRQRRPANHYGLPRLRRHFFVQRARVGLRWAAVALVLAAVGLALGIGLRGHAYEQATTLARVRAAQFRTLYQQRLSQLSEFHYRAVDVKNAVDLLDGLAGASSDHPGPMMASVGSVLDDHPNIVLDAMTWQVSDDPDLKIDVDQERAMETNAPMLTQLAREPARAYRYALLRGDVVGFSGNYRRAVQLFDAFVAGLRESGRFGHVEALEAPFDLKPDSGVSGDSGVDARDTATRRARFVVLVRRGGSDGNG